MRHRNHIKTDLALEYLHMRNIFDVVNDGIRKKTTEKH